MKRSKKVITAICTVALIGGAAFGVNTTLASIAKGGEETVTQIETKMPDAKSNIVNKKSEKKIKMPQFFTTEHERYLNGLGEDKLTYQEAGEIAARELDRIYGIEMGDKKMEVSMGFTANVESWKVENAPSDISEQDLKEAKELDEINGAGLHHIYSPEEAIYWTGVLQGKMRYKVVLDNITGEVYDVGTIENIDITDVSCLNAKELKQYEKYIPRAKELIQTYGLNKGNEVKKVSLQAKGYTDNFEFVDIKAVLDNDDYVIIRIDQKTKKILGYSYAVAGKEYYER